MFLWDWFTGVLGYLGKETFFPLHSPAAFYLVFTSYSRVMEKIWKAAVPWTRQCWKDNPFTYVEG